MAEGEYGGTPSEHRGSMGEQRERMRKQRGSMSTEQVLAGEQSGKARFSNRSRIVLSSGKICIYKERTRRDPSIAL